MVASFFRSVLRCWRGVQAMLAGSPIGKRAGVRTGSFGFLVSPLSTIGGVAGLSCERSGTPGVTCGPRGVSGVCSGSVVGMIVLLLQENDGQSRWFPAACTTNGREVADGQGAVPSAKDNGL